MPRPAKCSVLNEIVEQGLLDGVTVDEGKTLVCQCICSIKRRPEIRRLEIEVRRCVSLQQLQRLVYNSYLKFNGLGVVGLLKR